MLAGAYFGSAYFGSSFWGGGEPAPAPTGSGAYYGSSYWGRSYWGGPAPGTTPPGGGASAADIWNYILGNGLSAGETLVQLHARIVLNAPPTDVNVQWVNDRLVRGTGTPGDEWNPA